MIDTHQETAPANRRNSRVRSRPAHGIDRLCIENLHAELLHTATLSCATAGLIFSNRKEPGQLQLLTAYLPPAPSCFPAIAALLLNAPSLSSVLTALREYYACQDIARALTTAHAVMITHDRATGGLATLEAAWQAAAAAGLRAISELARQLPSSTHRAAHKRVQRALEAVCSADPDALEDFQHLLLPEHRERRSVTRATMRTQMLVERGTALIRLLVVTASNRGLGVQGITNAVPGECIRILWKPGVSIDTRVSRVGEGDFGLSFVSPTPVADAFVRSLLEAPQQPE